MFDSYADLQVPLEGVVTDEQHPEPSLYVTYSSATRPVSPRYAPPDSLASSPKDRKESATKEKERVDNMKEKERERLGEGVTSKTKKSPTMLPSPDTTPVPQVMVSSPRSSSGGEVPSPLHSSNSSLLTQTIMVGNSAIKDRVLESGMTLYSWTVYVRETAPGAIGWVEFKLHPSFSPDYIQRRSPPFELTRAGWGVFPVKVPPRSPTSSHVTVVRFACTSSQAGPTHSPGTCSLRDRTPPSTLTSPSLP